MNTHFAHYYKNVFPHKTICTLLAQEWTGASQLDKREVCIETTESSYIRWQSVSSPAELQHLLTRLNAAKFHTGAIYSNPPRLKKKGLVMDALKRELVFDIDLNDYTTLGIDPNDIDACDHAWPIVALGFRIVKQILFSHFDFKFSILVYSGRRGAHLTFYDAAACELTNEARAAIVAFIQPSTNHETKKQSFSTLMQMSDFGALYETHILPLWENFCVQGREHNGLGILDAPFDRDTFMDLLCCGVAKKALSTSRGSGTEFWARLCHWVNQHPENGMHDRVRNVILTYLWPKLDENVTKQRNHLSKSVFSVHPRTSRICLPIFGDSLEFTPNNCPVVSKLVSESSEALNMMNRAVSDTERFVYKLERSAAPVPAVQNHVYDMRPVRKKHRDEEDNAIYYVRGNRFVASLQRVFCVTAHADSSRATFSYYTKVPSPCVSTVYAGYSPPFRSPQTFQAKDFADAARDAANNPGVTFVVQTVFFASLFHPRNRSLDQCEERIQNLAERLADPHDLCDVNPAWDAMAIMTVAKDMIQDIWRENYAFLP